TFRRFPEFDFGVLGEAEGVVGPLFSALGNRESPSRLPGVVFREGDEIRTTPRGGTIEDLDRLPFPAYDLLPSFPRAYRPAFLNYLRGPCASVLSSRGCPQACTFCDRSVFGNRYRFFSEDYLLEWIAQLSRRHGVRHLVFSDDQFAGSRERLVRLCERIAGAGLDLQWNCDARADSIDPHLLKLMKRAGCWMISYGIESWSEEMLGEVRKRISLEAAMQALRWTREAGIRTKGLFMIGFPGETESSLASTVSFVRRSPLDEINLSYVTPYPGTEIYRVLKRSPDFIENWERMNALHPVVRPRFLPEGALEKAYAGILRQFYFRPGVTLSYAGLLLRSPENRSRVGRGLVEGLRGSLGRCGNRLFGLGRRALGGGHPGHRLPH
ncbi:MAG TPA: radical SAM protein, partial [Thermodesulfobacteriota bacterium]|nr:radical SAM protein [Thermodesulfobacteriota bacterium]